MKITLVVTTPKNGTPFNKYDICTTLINAIDQLKRDPQLPLVVGNPARANFETVYGEHVAVKVVRDE